MQSRFWRLGVDLARTLGRRFLAEQNGFNGCTIVQGVQGCRGVNLGPLNQQAKEDQQHEEGAECEQVHTQIKRITVSCTGSNDNGEDRERRSALLVQAADFNGLVAGCETIKVKANDPLKSLKRSQTALDGFVSGLHPRATINAEFNL